MRDVLSERMGGVARRQVLEGGEMGMEMEKKERGEGYADRV